jgi:hypothetical protein
MYVMFACFYIGFHDRDLAKLLSVEDFHALLKARIKLMESKMKMALEEQMREQMAHELQRLTLLDKHESAVLLVVVTVVVAE